MRTKYLLIALVVMVLTGIGYSAMALSERSESARTDDRKTKVLSTGLEDQTGVALTIYNVNLGLVKDQREIKLTKGTGEKNIGEKHRDASRIISSMNFK